MPAQNESKTYSLTHVAKAAQVSSSLVRKWENDGLIPHSKKDAKGFRTYTEKDLQTILNTKNHKAESMVEVNKRLEFFHAPKEKTKFYPISDIAKSLQVTQHVIRRWESEGLVAPSYRNEKGHRRYTEGDLQKIKQLQEKLSTKEAPAIRAEIRKHEEVSSKSPKSQEDPLYKTLQKVAKASKRVQIGAALSAAVLVMVVVMGGISTIKSDTAVMGLPRSLRSLAMTLGKGFLDIARNDAVTSRGNGGLAAVLAAQSVASKLKFVIAIPTRFLKDVTIAENLTVGKNAVIPNLNGVIAIDSTTEITLESALDIAGDVTSTGLNTVQIAENVIDDAELVNELNYTGTLNIEGTLQLQGTEISATADEINVLSGIEATVDEINFLSDTTVESGGVVYGDGTKFTQDTSGLSYNATTNRLSPGAVTLTNATAGSAITDALVYYDSSSQTQTNTVIGIKTNKMTSTDNNFVVDARGNISGHALSATGSVTINTAADTGQFSVEGSTLDINSLDFVGVGTVSSATSTDLTLSAGDDIFLSPV